MKLDFRAHLSAYADRPVIWGESDCCQFVAAWLRRHGVALALPAYASEAAARRLIARHGGLVELLREIASGAGLRETGAPEPGDVGVIDLSTGPVACIFIHGGYAALRTDSGTLWLMPRTIRAAWALPRPD